MYFTHAELLKVFMSSGSQRGSQIAVLPRDDSGVLRDEQINLSTEKGSCADVFGI